MAIEQFPFVAYLDRRVLHWPEYLVRIAVDDGRQSSVIRAGAVNFGTHRIRRRRIGNVDGGNRKRLQRETQVEVRHPKLPGLRPKGACASIHAAVAAGLDFVIVEADAAIEDQDIMIIRAIDEIPTRGVDGD